MVGFQVDWLVAELLHDHLDWVCLSVALRGLRRGVFCAFLFIFIVSFSLSALVLRAIEQALVCGLVLRLESFDEDLVAVFDELVVDVDNVPQLDCANGI